MLTDRGGGDTTDLSFLVRTCKLNRSVHKHLALPSFCQAQRETGKKHGTLHPQTCFIGYDSTDSDQCSSGRSSRHGDN